MIAVRITRRQRVLFEKAWELCENAGQCDGFGGMECKRVLAEWIDEGFPCQIEKFILRHANMRADGTLPPITEDN